jgi:hypothetical protein
MVSRPQMGRPNKQAGRGNGRVIVPSVGTNSDGEAGYYRFWNYYDQASQLKEIRDSGGLGLPNYHCPSTTKMGQQVILASKVTRTQPYSAART